jgi:hypothetical protein
LPTTNQQLGRFERLPMRTPRAGPTLLWLRCLHLKNNEADITSGISQNFGTGLWVLVDTTFNIPPHWRDWLGSIRAGEKPVTAGKATIVETGPERSCLARYPLTAKK